MRVPVMNENEKRIGLAKFLIQRMARSVQLFLRYVRVKNVVDAGVDDVFVSSGKPHALTEQRIDGAGEVAFVPHQLRQKRGELRASFALPPCATTPCFSGLWPVNKVVCDGCVGNNRTKHLLREHAFRCHLVDLRAGRQRVAITT